MRQGWTEQQRAEAIHLRTVANYTHREIGRVTGRSEHSVEQFFFRMRQKLGFIRKASQVNKNCKWTKERVQMAADMVAQNMTRRQIADAMGETHGAICGILDRAGKFGIVVPVSHAKRLYKKGPREAFAVRGNPKHRTGPRPIADAPIGIGTPLMELADNGCKFATGQTEKGSHLFCNAPRIQNSSWCGDHYCRVHGLEVPFQ